MYVLHSDKNKKHKISLTNFCILLILNNIMFKNLSAKYYPESKQGLQKKVRERYQNLSKEEKEKKQQYVRKRYKNFSEDEKQKLVSIEKNIIE